MILRGIQLFLKICALFIPNLIYKSLLDVTVPAMSLGCSIGGGGSHGSKHGFQENLLYYVKGGYNLNYN